jgi:hypothetical protein
MMLQDDLRLYAQRVEEGRQFVRTGVIPDGLMDAAGLVDRLTTTLQSAMRYAQAHVEIAEAVNAETVSTEPTKDDIRAMPCEACNAKPGEPCTQPSRVLNRVQVKWFHLSRIDLARRSS